ncbi:metallophosphoesterase family protein [bacterium]|nr:metallophosphoesterase family protein [bacterium]
MRIAVLSDIHGNLSALEAVLDDLRVVAPDLVLHGGDLAAPGAGPAEVLDRIIDLGWEGVMGNTDEMLTRPQSLLDFAARTPQLGAMKSVLVEIAEAARARLSQRHLDWLAAQPLILKQHGLALVHASPASCWDSPASGAADDELSACYGGLASPLVAFGHLHQPFIRSLPGITLVNCGSVGQPFDGDTRASYLLVTDGVPAIRRVEYDIEAECRRLAASDVPYADWVIRMLRAGRYGQP